MEIQKNISTQLCNFHYCFEEEEEKSDLVNKTIIKII